VGLEVGARCNALARETTSSQRGYREPVREQPAQQAPPVQRLRVRYAKRGRLRFTSHRDFSRAFERAVFRARIPMAYSSGFNPHPRISYAGAAPTGAASEAEYLEIGLSLVTDPDDVRRSLAAALPDGLDVVEVVEGTPGSLADRLEASRWTMVLDEPVGRVSAAVTAFLAVDRVPVERMTKKGLRTFDCREPVVSMTVGALEDGAVVDLTLRHTVPAVRPDDVLAGLRAVADLRLGSPPLLTRVQQGPLDPASGVVGDPLR
jgi:radical SAM-linked protein